MPARGGPDLAGTTVMLVGVGASGDVVGNGRATAHAFARAGARLALVDIDSAVLDECAREVAGIGVDHVKVAADVSRPSDVDHAVGVALDAFGRIDVLHNNVGVTQYGGLARTPVDEYDRVMSVNARSCYLLAQAVLPGMRERGGGVVTNVSSISSLRQLGIASPVYDMSKAAVNALTRHIAAAYGRFGVRANSLLLGMMDTPLARAGIAKGTRPLDEVYAEYERRIPAGRLGTGDDCASVAVFLASPGGSYLNGLELLLDGGLAVTTA
ncbi:SDR family NAD(P)-dependent oxidoreductase [Phytohabitans kaempferiae]|uniref:SDR family NAD(P)-dependent oxidoreductase n=1 Tax=Phytohabitans kaempferiae TaxID=1620943 RepID=A0ABV6M5E6_9ACTN